ncbi:MAG: hypothetical protein L6R19_26805 [Alphaproteobacteria bacterium]|nr:hypothetical protein [Alphaproteobacteria bacterium]
MMSVKGFFATIGPYTARVPDSVLAIVLLSATALLLHRTALGFLRRLIGGWHEYLQSLVSATYAPSRMALVIVAVAAVLPAAPLGSNAAAAVAHTLVMAFIVLLGWSAVTAVTLATDF